MTHTVFEPSTSALGDFELRVRRSLERQAAVRSIGARIESVTAGRAVVAMAHRPELTQQHGFVHAGIVSTALDTACGYAAFSLMPDDAAVLTIEFKVNFLAPARVPQLRFEGNVTKAGRTITVVDGQAFEFEHGERSVPKRIATMIATIMTVRGREGLQD
jgi:uncharacterized protein (TIGR00369 family)